LWDEAANNFCYEITRSKTNAGRLLVVVTRASSGIGTEGLVRITKRRELFPPLCSSEEPVLSAALLAAALSAAALLTAALLTTALSAATLLTAALLTATLLTASAALSLAILLSALLSSASRSRLVWILLSVHDAFLCY